MNKVSYQFQREKSNTVRDIFDGKNYQENMKRLKQASASSDLLLTLSLSTDGVKIFKSSAKSMWPIWLRINELPPSIR